LPTESLQISIDEGHVLAKTRTPVSRVTSKLQVTVPKAIADRYDIRPGDDIDWVPAGDVIRVVPAARRMPGSTDSRVRRLALFDQATERHRERQRAQKRRRRVTDRGWRREDL
jgi:AbrB family looped-hinge helix DNA binding protein